MDKSNQYSFSTLSEESVEYWLKTRFQTTLLVTEPDILLAQIQNLLLKKFSGYILNDGKINSAEAYICFALEQIAIGETNFKFTKVWRRLDKHINTMKCIFTDYDAVTGLRQGEASLSTDNYLASAYIWLVIFNKSREFRYFNNVLKTLELIALHSLTQSQSQLLESLVTVVCAYYHQEVGNI